MEQNSLNPLDNALKLYRSMLDDIIAIFDEQFMENVSKYIFNNVFKKGCQIKINLIKALLNDVQIRLNPEILESIDSFLNSVQDANKGKYDYISRKDEISLIAYCYCIIDTFNYLIRKKDKNYSS